MHKLKILRIFILNEFLISEKVLIYYYLKIKKIIIINLKFHFNFVFNY
jgi:hypothetical protein